jgi:hypothetical protein
VNSLIEDRWLSALSLVDGEVRRRLRRRYDLLGERARSAFRGLATTSSLELLELVDVGLVDEAGEVSVLARCFAAELSTPAAPAPRRTRPTELVLS